MNNKTILCAIDFSESSLSAIHWTLETAQLTGAKVTVLFCYRLIPTADHKESLELKRNSEEAAKMKFNEIEKSLVHGRPLSCQFICQIGFFPFLIDMQLRNAAIGLLVMGKSIVQSFTDYKSLSFEQFLKDTKVPVVVVP